MTTTTTIKPLITHNLSTGLLEMEIDNTSLEHFSVCARSAQYRLVNQREGNRNMAAKNFGSAKHLYLEARSVGRSVTEAQQILLDYMLACTPDEDVDEWRTVTLALESMEAYERYWHSTPLEPVVHDGHPLVEIPFRLPLCDIVVEAEAIPERLRLAWSLPSFGTFTLRVYWTGRIDMVAEFLSENFVVDHKTTSVAGPGFYDEFQLSSQTLGYTWAGNHLWPELRIRGLRLNALIGRKPTKTGKAHEFIRQTFIYSDEHLAEWHHNVQVLVSDFISHLLRDYFPMQTKWCQGKYGVCQYFPTCTALPSQRSIVLGSDMYQDVTWSPLNPRT